MADKPTTETTPNRIQRRRLKGWRMPKGAIYVGRGSRWGNPYRVGTCLVPDAQAAVDAFRANLPIAIANLLCFRAEIWLAGALSGNRVTPMCCWRSRMPPEQTTENTPRWVTIIQASGPATEQRVIVIEQDRVRSHAVDNR